MNICLVNSEPVKKEWLGEQLIGTNVSANSLGIFVLFLFYFKAFVQSIQLMCTIQSSYGLFFSSDDKKCTFIINGSKN